MLRAAAWCSKGGGAKERGRLGGWKYRACATTML